MCDHSTLRFSSSDHANTVSYERPAIQQRAKAAGGFQTSGDGWDRSFPAPFVIPKDELSYDPYDSQSVPSWLREKARNEVTK